MELQEACKLQLEDVLEMDAKNEELGIIEGYTLNKDLILEAWARFRPVQNEMD